MASALWPQCSSTANMSKSSDALYRFIVVSRIAAAELGRVTDVPSPPRPTLTCMRVVSAESGFWVCLRRSCSCWQSAAVRESTIP